jgi:hypothetical protein
MSQPKYARRSFAKEPYLCLKPWPETCFVQCGGDGVVFTGESINETLKSPESQLEALATVAGVKTSKKHYRTAFFEACPKDPKCFIRGEGKTVEEAEESAFTKYQKILVCTHDFDRKDREDGYCHCKHCPLSGSFLPPTTSCFVCNKPAHHGQDLTENWYCKTHYYQLPVDQVCDPAKKDEKSGFVSESEQREEFIRSQTEWNLLTSLGYDIESDKAEQLKNCLIRYCCHIDLKNQLEKDPAKKIPEQELRQQHLKREVLLEYLAHILAALPELALWNSG